MYTLTNKLVYTLQVHALYCTVLMLAKSSIGCNVFACMDAFPDQTAVQV